MISKLRNMFNEWQERHKEEFKKEQKPEAEFLSESGIPIRRVYTPLDLEEKGFEYEKDLGMPGDFPYTRGLTPGGYRVEPWSQSLYSGYATPEESNKLWREAVKTGVETVFIAYDLPTQLGYDPDSQMARGEVGKIGVSLTTQKDWEIAFDGIDLNKVRISQVPNAVAAFQVANLIHLAERTGADLNKIRGHCQNDILKEYTVRGNYIFPPEPSLRLAIDIVSYCRRVVPQYLTMSVTGLHFSEFQCTPVHEAAFMLADLYCYLDEALKRGLDIDDLAPSIELSTGIDHYTFFEEIAKHRAIRRVFSRAMKERFNAKNPESLKARIGAAQGGNSLQREQYLNNIARTAITAVAATLSGVGRLTLRPYDEQYGIPTPEAMMTTTRVKYVITQETDILNTVDPLAGSYFVEWLTSEFEERITKDIEAIDKQGGALKCIENGYIKRKLVEDAYKWQKDFEAGKVVRVGANFATTETVEKPVSVYRTDPKVEQQRIEAVNEVKKWRDNAKVKKALDELKAIALLPASPDNNLMPPIVEAVKCYATNGEVTGALREIWGEHIQRDVF
ncbi:methylmalonyl-CoA mutase family protein [Chloroflexota bacterium]